MSAPFKPSTVLPSNSSTQPETSTPAATSQSTSNEAGAGAGPAVGTKTEAEEAAAEASPAWERGTVVQLFGLVGRPELNETAGVVVQFDEARGRYAVTVPAAGPPRARARARAA